jgi:bifunctional non-homologous end joining protein LigD
MGRPLREIAHSVRYRDAILDGELVCLNDDGRSNFHNLLFRRDGRTSTRLTSLALHGKDLGDRPLLERKRILRPLMPRHVHSRLLYIDHLKERGCALFKAACVFDLEGIVAKWTRRPYRCHGVSTS